MKCFSTQKAWPPHQLHSAAGRDRIRDHEQRSQQEVHIHRNDTPIQHSLTREHQPQEPRAEMGN